ncbi:MAG: Ubiquinone biosynthesis O-methyltransferase [Myxococcota bacterium]|nr:Ubiquinone biosynthesis O-methyltransferase [Myxococcota bacterium]
MNEHSFCLYARPVRVATPNLHRGEEIGDAWWDPRGPARLLHRIYPLALQFFQETIPLDGAVRVLNLGARAGVFTELWKTAGAKTYGCDPSGDLIAIAKRHAQEQGLFITYVQSQLVKTPFEDAFFDVVVLDRELSGGAARSLLSETQRLLKPGGRLAVLEYGKPWNAPLMGFAAGELPARVRSLWSHPPRALPAEQAEALLADQKLKVCGRGGMSLDLGALAKRITGGANNGPVITLDCAGSLVYMLIAEKPRMSAADFLARHGEEGPQP